MQESIQQIVAYSLEEDIGQGDINADLLSEYSVMTAQVMTREFAVFCGSAWAQEVFRQLDPTVTFHWNVADGDKVVANQVLLTLTGPVRSLVTGERCLLNWLQTLSGTATVVYQYLQQLQDTSVQLLDTRKTIPGLRRAQKYAVRCAGGMNHRLNLAEAYLIKENHILSCGSITEAVLRARQFHASKKIEIEVENLNELQEALKAGVELILLDNFNLDQMREAVSMNQGKAKLEVSGNVNLCNIRQIAETGIDYISVGALTKNLKAIDLSMRIL